MNATPGLFKSISHLFKFSHYVSNITNIPSQRFLQSFLRRTLKNRCGRPLPRNRRSPCSALFFDLWGRGASCEELCGLHIDSTCLSTYLSGYRNICFYVFFLNKCNTCLKLASLCHIRAHPSLDLDGTGPWGLSATENGHFLEFVK